MEELSPYLAAIMKGDINTSLTGPEFGGPEITEGQFGGVAGPTIGGSTTNLPPIEGPGGGGQSGTPSPTGSTGYAGGQIKFPTDIAGRPYDDKAILPGVIPPVNGDLQQQFLNYILSQVGKGSSPYPGQLSPDVNSTRLPQVWNSWQPWDGGTQYLAQQISGGLGIGKNSPLLDKAMQYGGTGGPGHQAMSNMINYGTPSSIGQFLSNMAQFGVASEGSGRPLANLAAGYATGPAAFLAPFLTAGAPPNYSAPNIPGRTPKIGA